MQSDWGAKESAPEMVKSLCYPEISPTNHSDWRKMKLHDNTLPDKAYKRQQL